MCHIWFKSGFFWMIKLYLLPCSDFLVSFKVFHKPMSESGRLTEAEMNMIFVNWRELIQCSSKMHKYVRLTWKYLFFFQCAVYHAWFVYWQGTEDKEKYRRRQNACSHDRGHPGLWAVTHAGLHPLLQLPAEWCRAAATENRPGARLQNFP